MHIIHVGNMANKGTQALLTSDIAVLRDIVNREIHFSVSTTDIEGVKRLNLSLDAVLPPLVDIPYERADVFAKRFGFTRDSVTYKVFAVGSLMLMSIQALASAISAVFVKLGLKGFYRAEVLKAMKGSHIVISCSDENFKESASLLPVNIYWALTWWSMLFSRTWDVLAAKLLGKRIVMFPNSVGPFRTWLGLLIGKLALSKCDFILVREPISLGVVNSLGIRSHKRLTSDTVLLLTGTNKANLGNVSHPLVGVSPGFYAQSLSKTEANRYIVEHARVLDYVIEKYGFHVVFLPHYVSGFHNDDLDTSRQMLQQMRNKEQAEIVETSSVEAFKSILDCMDLVISSKMHPAVLATSGYVPTLCVAYDHKQSGFFQRLDLADCVLSIREFSYTGLLSRIEHIWDEKDRIKTILKKKIPPLQEDVRRAIRHALACCLDVE